MAAQCCYCTCSWRNDVLKRLNDPSTTVKSSYNKSLFLVFASGIFSAPTGIRTWYPWITISQQFLIPKVPKRYRMKSSHKPGRIDKSSFPPDKISSGTPLRRIYNPSPKSTIPMTGGRGGLTGGRALLNGPFFSNGTRVFFIHVFFLKCPRSLTSFLLWFRPLICRYGMIRSLNHNRSLVEYFKGLLHQGVSKVTTHRINSGLILSLVRLGAIASSAILYSVTT